MQCNVQTGGGVDTAVATILAASMLSHIHQQLVISSGAHFAAAGPDRHCCLSIRGERGATRCTLHSFFSDARQVDAKKRWTGHLQQAEKCV